MKSSSIQYPVRCRASRSARSSVGLFAVEGILTTSPNPRSTPTKINGNLHTRTRKYIYTCRKRKPSPAGKGPAGIEVDGESAGNLCRSGKNKEKIRKKKGKRKSSPIHQPRGIVSSEARRFCLADVSKGMKGVVNPLYQRHPTTPHPPSDIRYRMAHATA